MPFPLATLLASSLVFPSFEMQETGLEGFGVDTVAPGANAPFEFTDLNGGFGVQQRAVFIDPSGQPRWGMTGRVRFRIDDNADGNSRVYFEDVLASPGPLYLLARPDFGDVFEFGVGPYQSEIGIIGKDTGSMQLRVFLPLTLVPFGLANTDQDTDKKLKYVFRAGLGAGADATFGLGKKLLVVARTQADYRYAYRAGEQSLTHDRAEVEWLFDAGLGLRTSSRTAVLATFFFQEWWQWDYDAALDGVARGNEVIGGRLTFRHYVEFDKPAPAPAPTPTEPLDKPTSPQPLGKPTSPG